VFEGQRALKLVTHCRNTDDYEQYILHEYLVYRIFNLLTPRSFRARLVKTNYFDAAAGKQVAARYGMFLEDDDDVARRAEGRIVDVPNVLFKEVDPESLTRMALFQFMIANTDFSIIRLHNVRLIQDPRRVISTVPYDFDFSGLVDAPYANPDKKLGIASVRDRLYRGPCRTAAALDPLLEGFRAKKAEILALYESLPDLAPAYRRQARQYLDGFYSVIEHKDRVQKVFVDRCTPIAGM
jgi:hypothetical protein